MKKRFNILFPILCILLLALLVASPLVLVSPAPAQPNEVMLAKVDTPLPATSESIMTQSTVGNPDIPRIAALAVLLTVSIIGLIISRKTIVRRHFVYNKKNSLDNGRYFAGSDVSSQLNCPLFGAV